VWSQAGPVKVAPYHAVDGRLSAPLGLTHHQRRHQLRGTPAVADIDAAAAARIPTENEELCLQEEAVFFLFGEHVVTGFLTRLYEPSPSSLSDNPAVDFGGKERERPFCSRSWYSRGQRGQ
jgi:hypothetical protein